jgi:uncharacterized protein YnzC (UPF0291/DUF896 family)
MFRNEKQNTARTGILNRSKNSATDHPYSSHEDESLCRHMYLFNIKTTIYDTLSNIEVAQKIK